MMRPLQKTSYTIPIFDSRRNLDWCDVVCGDSHHHVMHTDNVSRDAVNFCSQRLLEVTRCE